MNVLFFSYKETERIIEKLEYFKDYCAENTKTIFVLESKIIEHQQILTELKSRI